MKENIKKLDPRDFINWSKVSELLTNNNNPTQIRKSYKKGKYLKDVENLEKKVLLWMNEFKK